MQNIFSTHTHTHTYTERERERERENLKVAVTPYPLQFLFCSITKFPFTENRYFSIDFCSSWCTLENRYIIHNKYRKSYICLYLGS